MKDEDRGEVIILEDWAAETSQSIPLSLGSWTIKVAGRISVGGQAVEVSEGSVNVQVIPGPPVPAAITMKPKLDSWGQGTFQYDPGEDCPVLAGIPGLASAGLALTRMGTGAPAAVIDLLDGGQPAEIELPAGYYTAEVILVNDTGERAAKTEAVHIYRGMATVLGDSAVFRFRPEDFTGESFDSIEGLRAYLSAAPANTAETPYLVKLRGIDLEAGLTGENGDPLRALFDAFQGKYVSLDLSAYTGAVIPSTTTIVAQRPDRDKLVGLILPGSVTFIGNYAFNGSHLKSVNFSELRSLTFIGDGAFTGARFTGLDLSACTSLTTIGPGEGSFMLNPMLESVILPGSLTTLGNSTFRNCTALTEADLSACTSLTEIIATFQGCAALESVALPDSITTINFSAFQGCAALESIDLPVSLTTIGGNALGGAFQNCTALVSLDFSRCTSLDNIGNYAFRNCAALESVDLPASLATIGNSAFQGCAALESVISRNPAPPALPSNAFTGCNALTEIQVPPASVSGYENAAGWGGFIIVPIATP
jgi:hypothetical protein